MLCVCVCVFGIPSNKISTLLNLINVSRSNRASELCCRAWNSPNYSARVRRFRDRVTVFSFQFFTCTQVFAFFTYTFAPRRSIAVLTNFSFWCIRSHTRRTELFSSCFSISRRRRRTFFSSRFSTRASRECARTYHIYIYIYTCDSSKFILSRWISALTS